MQQRTTRVAGDVEDDTILPVSATAARALPPLLTPELAVLLRTARPLTGDPQDAEDVVRKRSSAAGFTAQGFVR